MKNLLWSFLLAMGLLVSGVSLGMDEDDMYNSGSGDFLVEELEEQDPGSGEEESYLFVGPMEQEETDETMMPEEDDESAGYEDMSDTDMYE